MRKADFLIGSLVVAMLALPAFGQEAWPTRPVRFVVPSSPGGATDYYARLMAQTLGETLKQQIIVDNRPGANGIIGAEMVAKAAPDGYTILVSSSPVLIINPALYKTLPYNPERDFAPIAQGVISPLVWIIHSTSPGKTLGDLVAAAKREPGTVPYGSTGSGSLPHLGVLRVEEVSGARFIHVPYKGTSRAYPDLLGGNIKFMLADIGTALPHIKSGKLSAIAVTERISQLPGVPTFSEAGFANVEPKDLNTSFSIAAPAGTPPALVQRLSSEINRAMKSAAVAEKLDAQVLIPVFDTPESFAAASKQDRAKWAAFIRRNSIVPDP
jgi:tripartite-type tricarboxylate transporter receptor subunit TctC